MSAPDPRALLEQHLLRAKKSFGQNFLRDMSVHRAVAAALALTPHDTVIELGAGLGTLTAHLAETGARVIAIERDRDLVPILRAAFAAAANVNVVEGDAKKINYADYRPAPPGALCVAGNIPYQLTSPIIFSLLAARGAVSRAALLIQREVAERILAAPGNKTYGLLSVLLGALAELWWVRDVPRGAFYPVPRVDSAVIAWRFTRPPSPHDRLFIALARACFQKRRKTMKNALASFGAEALAAAGAVGIDLQARPETITPETYWRLAERLAAEQCQ